MFLSSEIRSIQNQQNVQLLDIAAVVSSGAVVQQLTVKATLPQYELIDISPDTIHFHSAIPTCQSWSRGVAPLCCGPNSATDVGVSHVHIRQSGLAYAVRHVPDAAPTSCHGGFGGRCAAAILFTSAGRTSRLDGVVFARVCQSRVGAHVCASHGAADSPLGQGRQEPAGGQVSQDIIDLSSHSNHLGCVAVACGKSAPLCIPVFYMR